MCVCEACTLNRNVPHTYANTPTETHTHTLALGGSENIQFQYGNRLTALNNGQYLGLWLTKRYFLLPDFPLVYYTPLLSANPIRLIQHLPFG